MKRKGILLFIILLTNLLPLQLMAQDKKILVEPVKEDKTLLHGIDVGVDVGGLIENVFGSDYNSASVSLKADLKNRYMPIIEIGYGKINTINEDNSIKYKTQAPFFKIGADYNFFYKKPYLPGFLYGGIRICHSSFSYDVSAPNMTDPTWGNITVPFSYNDVKGSTTWTELVVGVKAKVFGNFHMGWSARYRAIISNKKRENTEPLYIPGYGMSNASKFGFTYNLIYNIPLKK